MLRMSRIALLFLLLVSPLAFAKSKLMEPAADQAPKPEAGKALVVFMRPSFFGGAISSSLYDAPDGATRVLGVLKYKDKLAVQMEPGEHRLMVVSENADFLDTTLEAGKTYYVLVKARPGAWKARFSLIPVHNRADAEYNLQSVAFKEWSDATSFVSTTPEASGASGPTTVSWIFCSSAHSRSAFRSVIGTFSSRGSSSVPPLPGAT